LSTTTVDAASSRVHSRQDGASTGGVVQIVMPQNWLFLTSYKKQRESLLQRVQWNLLARLGPGAFETISGEVVQAVLLAMKWLETAQTADWAKVMPSLPHLGQRSDHILAWEKARSALSADGQPLEGDVSAVLASMRQLKLKPTFDGDWRRVVAPQFVQRAKTQAA